MKLDAKLISDDFRFPHELYILYGSLSIIVILTLIVMGLSPIIPIIIIIYSTISIKIGRRQLFGNTIRVTGKSFSQIHQASKMAAERLSMDMPEVFVKQSPFLNAYSIGFFGQNVKLFGVTLCKKHGFEMINRTFTSI